MLMLFYIGIIILLIRTLQRYYYYTCNHEQIPFNYNPNKEIEKFAKDKNTRVVHKSFKSEKDRNISLQYDIIGHGKQIIILGNGIGTRLFIWLPTLKQLHQQYNNIFSEFTFISPRHRGLFENENEIMVVPISIQLCTQDLNEMLKKEKVKTIAAFVGWSVGSQIALTYGIVYPDQIENLLLLNPTTGKTLHTALQPIIALPSIFHPFVSFLLTKLFKFLLIVADGIVFTLLRASVFSNNIFQYILFVFSFFTGMSQNFSVYGTCYFKDVLSSRKHTKGLIHLILSLDDALPFGADSLTLKTVIISSYFDYMTGVYHANRLKLNMLNSKHICSYSATHFLLIEWPDVVAGEILKLVYKN